MGNDKRGLNMDLLRKLHQGGIAYDFRATGKTTTLLTFVAVRMGAVPFVPMVLADSDTATRNLRSQWRELFGSTPEPLWMSYRSFLRNRGMICDVFVDEPQFSWNMDQIRDLARVCNARVPGGGLFAGVSS